MNFKNLFQNFCKKNNLEINSYQLVIIDELESFYKLNFNKSILNKFFLKNN
jgi:cell division protein ZapE